MALVNPFVKEFEDYLKTASFEEGVLTFRRKHPVSSVINHGGWNYFLSPNLNGEVLEIGAGIGDDSLLLSRKYRKVSSLVSSREHEELLRKRFAETGISNIEPGIGDNLEQLPFPDSSFSAAVLEEESFSDFEISAKRFPNIARELTRILRPGGVLVFGISNPLFTRHFLGRAMALVKGKRHALTMDRIFKSGSAALRVEKMAERGKPCSPSGIIECMRETHRAEVKRFAPFPDERKPRIVVPVDDKTVVRYFLKNLIPLDSFPRRAGTVAATAANRMGLFKFCVPYYYLVFRLPGGETNNSLVE